MYTLTMKVAIPYEYIACIVFKNAVFTIEEARQWLKTHNYDMPYCRRMNDGLQFYKNSRSIEHPPILVKTLITGIEIYY